MRRLPLLIALLLAPALAGAAATVPPPARPKIVAILVVDQLGYEGMQRMRPWFGKGGFRRLLEEGAFFPETYYGHQNTYTGPGHATIATGAYAHLNGVVANRFYDRSRRKSFQTFSDPGHQLIDAPTEPDGEPSPVNMVCESLGDRLRLTTGMKAKVISVGLKDRGAVPLGGKVGQTYFFSEPTGAMTSSTYYMKELPAWVRTFNERKLADSYFGKVWDRAAPDRAYLGEDDVAWEDEKLHGRVFPHTVDGKLDRPGPGFYKAFASSPFGLEYTVAFAKAAVAGEQLGQHAVPDLLAVTFSSYDYVGHAFGPDSHEQQDMTLRVDRAIADLLAFLEKAAGGRQNLLVGFVADHGVTPAPEYMASLGFPAARIKKGAIKDAIHAELTARFGPGEWVVALEDPNVYLDEKLISDRKLDPSLVQDAAGQAVMKIPGFLTYYTRSRLLRGEVDATALGRAVQLSFYPERSGDVVLVTRPYFFWGRYGERTAGSTHGSPYRYDTHVPMAFWGFGVKAVKSGNRAEPTDFSMTLARLLDMDPPACAEGEARPEVVR